MKWFALTFPRNVAGCYRGRMILWHLLAIALTCALVRSGFDWWYHGWTMRPVLIHWMFPAVVVGGLLPILLPFMLILMGAAARSERIQLTGWAVGQAEAVGALIVATYKAFTGRVHPPFGTSADISRDFQFGLMRGGVFWGWPSSHTTVAFAMAVTVFVLFPKSRWAGCLAIVYALYVGLGVSMTIHWFSDFVAGAIIGSVVGVVVGKSFLGISRTTGSESRPGVGTR